MSAISFSDVSLPAARAAGATGAKKPAPAAGARARVTPDMTVAEAIAVIKNAPDGRAEVVDSLNAGGGDAVLAELFLSDPGLHDELAGAKEVQQRLLPRVVPTVPGWEFAGRYSPAGHVGGDYWSVKYYREDNVVTCKLADVTGHGIAAAILVAAVKFVSGVLFRNAKSPAQVMERTNHSLIRETSPDRMATMIYAWIYPQTRRVRLVNAGHAPAFFVHGASGVIETIPPTGPLLGLIETTYEELTLTLSPGDVLFFCSDGVAEAGDPKQFGEARVREIVAQHRHQGADALADAVFEAARGCCGPPKDDMSLLVIKAVEPRPAATTPAGGARAKAAPTPAPRSAAKENARRE